jgi:hypothetical protein
MSNPSAKARYLLANANPVVIRGTLVIAYQILFMCRNA